MSMTFSEWMKSVNREMWNTFGLGADDAGDAPWRDYHDDGLDPKSAVQAAREEAWLF